MPARTAVLCLLLSVQLACGEYTGVVRVEQGRLRGQRSILNGQKKYLGIPYAVSERFQGPQKPPKWRGIFYATDALVLCPQKILVSLGSENCTVLNVFTPEDAESTSSYPVMVFFHGGSFFYGSSTVTNYDPSYLVDHGVIVVTVNYRLGVFGFLCLGVDGAAGNMGLKDQSAALKWIQENIKEFGGNPDRVTIFGESAGAASVHMHMLSKMSQGLFQSVIMQSGSAIAPWALNVNPLQDAIVDVSKLGVLSKNPHEILNVFRKLPLTTLLDITKDSTLQNTYKYCPCVEQVSKNSFLTETPYNLMLQGNFSKVPVMMGMNSAEGIFFAGLHNYKTISDMNANFGDYIPRAFAWKSTKQKWEVEEAIRKYYFGNVALSKARIDRLVDFYSDTLTTYSTPRTSELITEFSQAPVYNYHFSYEGGRNFVKYFMGTGVKGVSHADDLFYLFKPSSFPLPISARDKLIVYRMTKMWTNFAKYGNPTPRRIQQLPQKWLPSDRDHTVYMNIDSEMMMIKKPYVKRIQFWENMYNTYGKQGFVSPVR